MNQWTEGANNAWERYCEQVRTLLSKTEADANEVIEDMRRHIEAELAGAGAKVVTEHDVQRVVKRIGLPDVEQINDQVEGKENLAVDAGAKSRASVVAARRRKSMGVSVLIILFGCILPTAALLVELATGICGEVFFDPIPTIWHILLFLLIPVANLAACVAVSKDKVKYFKKLGLFNAVALGIAFIYTLLFAPILPISVFAILVFGLGFCGLAPLLSLLATLLCRVHIRYLSPEGSSRRVPGLWAGLALGILGMALAVLPASLTHLGIQMAASDSAKRQIRGVTLLRAVGDEDIILEACYRRFGIMTDLFTALAVAGDPASPEQVRGVYYRVTGRPFNSVPPPLTGVFGVRQRTRFLPDFDQGDINVGAQLMGLSLVSSRMDGSIDSDAALCYIEWIMVFRNDHDRQQREARAQVQLPGGGVVSRLTLWIDGEEREAAFASRSRTREAYQSIVRQQRDPVLVTTNGPERVLMQCFPVPVRGGEMKVRMGITVPLQLLTDDETVLRLPHFNERNFHIPERTKHAIWLESKRAISSAVKSFVTENPSADLHALRGELSDEALVGEEGVIKISRTAEVFQTWTNDPVKGSNEIIIQSITPTVATVPERVVLVIDSSVSMGEATEQIAEVIQSVPTGIEVEVLITGDTVRKLTMSATPMSAELGRLLAGSIRGIKRQGGMDNMPALKEAWDIAVEGPNSVIVWITAVQPQLFESVESLQQRWERRPHGPTLIHVPAVAGINRIVESLDGLTQVGSLPRTTSLGRDLQMLFDRWKGNEPTYEITWKRAGQDQRPVDGAKQTSAHLARLWAKNEIDVLRRSKGKNYLDKAIALATTYQLVTPVSGAVVLESEQQYERAGLEPVDPTTVPTIPEPEIWMLLTIAACVLGWVVLRKRAYLRLA